MIQTKLILLEGPPGSGKSTTARGMAEEIIRAGLPCRCILEWDNPHPIPIGDDLDLNTVLDTALQRAPEMLHLWQRFAEAQQEQEIITVLESRFWQTSVMLMYAAGASVNDVLAHNRQVSQIIRPLNPVLVYFEIDDLSGFTDGVIRGKEAEWQRGGSPGTWAGHIFEAFAEQPWFVSRGVNGLDGYTLFLEEWKQVTERLYEQLPFQKTRVRNPYLDWNAAADQMRKFLGL
ncbi:MAG: hypothetical protein JW750_12615 [Anaerolineaceae bacterium]|nr:hypothetical protein [Anaerolineaceae bacterium]